MLTELRCNVMVKDFLKNTTRRSIVCMNEKTLRNFIDQWRVYAKWDDDAMTIEEMIQALKDSAEWHTETAWIYYNEDVPEGYMKVM